MKTIAIKDFTLGCILFMNKHKIQNIDIHLDFGLEEPGSFTFHFMETPELKKFIDAFDKESIEMKTFISTLRDTVYCQKLVKERETI